MTATISDPARTARQRAGRSEQPPRGAALFGREAEQRVIRDLLRQAELGLGGVVLVDGESGIGKSALLRRCTDEAAEQGFSVAVAAAGHLDYAIPYSALHEALRDPFPQLTADDPGRDQPEGSEWRITQIGQHLRRRAAVAPVLVCLDDLHWAGPVTMAALQRLTRDFKQHRMAWLLARSGTRQRAADYLFGQLEKDGARRITLAPLDEDAVTAMLTGALGAPPDQALAELARGAAGNPSLLAELISGLRDARATQVTNGQVEIASQRLPQRLHGFARQRLDGLGSQARHLLMTAAVLDLEFRLEDAAEMLSQTPAALLPAVEEAIDEAIVTASENMFTFRHPLLRRAIDELIPRPAREALHRQYGEILLARGDSPARAATHLLQAAHSDPISLAGLDKAAARALQTAPQTAAGLALRALELTSPADPAVLSRTVATVEALTAAGQVGQAARIARDLLAKPLASAVEDRLRCALSAILCASGQPKDAADQAQLVLDRPQLAENLRDQALNARLQALVAIRDADAGQAADSIQTAVAGYDSTVPVAAQVARGIISWDNGRISEGLARLREAARRSPAFSADARDNQPLLALAAALIDLRQLSEAADILRTADNPALQQIPAGAAISLLRGRVHLAAGRLAEAAAECESALMIARDLGALGYAATAGSVLCVIELRRGDIMAAEHAACRPVAGPQFADIYARPEAAMAHAQVTEARDGPSAVLSNVRQVVADLRSLPGLLVGDPALAAWLARTALAAGDSGLAASVAVAAQALADAYPDFPALAAAAAHSQGVARRDPGCLAEAVTRHLDPWGRASAAEDLGVLHAGHGDRAQAIRYLKEAISGYQESEADRDQARVRRRLRRLGIRRRHWNTPADRPVTGWHSLTATEQAVAGLVAQGLSNNQVAARMYISTHTVAHHLRQAFRKLSIASRYELTRIVIGQAADG